MKIKRSMAILLSAVMVFSLCTPLRGMSANAAENAEVLNKEEATEVEEYATPKTLEEKSEPEDADAQEEMNSSDEQNEEISAEQEATGVTEDSQGGADSKAEAESSDAIALEKESVEAVTEESSAQEEEKTEIQEEDEELVEITEPVQLEENREAVSDSSSSENVAQAIWTEGNKTFTFYYGPEVSVGQSFRGNAVTDVWSGESVTDVYPNSAPLWYDDRINDPLKEATSIVFDKSFLAVKPKNMGLWFYNLYKVTTIDLSGLDSSEVTDMRYLFGSCSIKSIDLRGLDTSNVKSMEGLFYNCTELETVNMSGLNTSNVTNMSNMFWCCASMTSLDMTGIDTSKVTDMNSMFEECQNLTNLDVSGFDTSNVTDMSRMFEGCQNLTSLDVSGFDTSNVTNMLRMFFGCKGLNSLDVSRFNTAKVTDMRVMFYGCQNLKTIYCSDSSTDWKITSSNENMFEGCSSLVGKDGSYKVSYTEKKCGTSMAKAASLGGYFTPQNSSYVDLGKTTRGDLFNLANNIKVTWEAVPGAEYYKVYRNGVSEPVIVTKELVGWDNCTTPALEPGKIYTYKIVASLTGKNDSSGDSPLFYSKSIYRLKTTAFKYVKNTAPGKVTVSYKKSEYGDSYVILYADNADMKNAKSKVIYGADTTAVVLGGFKKGKTYWFQIRVRKSINGYKLPFYTTFGTKKAVKIAQ